MGRFFISALFNQTDFNIDKICVILFLYDYGLSLNFVHQKVNSLTRRLSDSGEPLDI
jgi:hypothetical protein